MLSKKVIEDVKTLTNFLGDVSQKIKNVNLLDLIEELLYKDDFEDSEKIERAVPRYDVIDDELILTMSEIKYSNDYTLKNPLGIKQMISADLIYNRMHSTLQIKITYRDTNPKSITYESEAIKINDYKTSTTSIQENFLPQSILFDYGIF